MGGLPLRHAAATAASIVWAQGVPGSADLGILPPTFAFATPAAASSVPQAATAV